MHGGRPGGVGTRELRWLELFHSSLMTTANFELDELEDLDEWKAMLVPGPAQSSGVGSLRGRRVPAGFNSALDTKLDLELHVLLVAETGSTDDDDVVPDPAGGRVLSGAVCELYLASSVAHMTYLVTHPSHRGKGLARRMCGELVHAVHERFDGHTTAILLECHRVGATDGSMSPAARLSTYERLGWLGCDVLPFIPPMLEVGADPTPIGQLCLLVHESCCHSGEQQAPQEDEAPSTAAGAPGKTVGARCVRSWLLEYWSKYHDEDLTPLRVMVDYIDSVEDTGLPVVPPSSMRTATELQSHQLAPARRGSGSSAADPSMVRLGSAMSPETLSLWRVLGWTPENWQSAVGVWSEGFKWSDLSDTARAAAEQLGFSKSDWDEEQWEWMSMAIRQRWEVLGWTQSNWTSGGGVWSEYLNWAELPPTAQRVASDLGFTASSWDGEMEPEWMAASTHKLWEALGWNRHNWAQGKDAGVWSEALSWVELDHSARSVAQGLGFTPQSWNDGPNPPTALAASASMRGSSSMLAI